MSLPRVYVTRTIPPRSLALLHAASDIEIRVHEGDMPPSRENFLAEIAQADGVLTMLTEKMDTEAIAAAPRLKVISNFAVGYDNIDVPAATLRKIPVGNTPGVLTECTADLAFALLLAAARRLSEGETYIQHGEWRTWNPIQLPGYDVYGATLGIIGLGRIGQAVARRAHGFGMRILYSGGSDDNAAKNLYAHNMALDDLLRESDFISVHVPLKPETRYLINQRELALMKPTAILINTARGAVVHPGALYAALKNGTIAAAALDVTDPEPIPLTDPLLTLPNCLIVPHIGSSTHATRERMGAMAVQNLLAGIWDEKLPHCVNLIVYD